jgi:hypothetical protein
MVFKTHRTKKESIKMNAHIVIATVALSALLLVPSTAAAKDCVVPPGEDGMTEELRQQCIDNASIASRQPDLDPEAIRRGPGGPAAIAMDKPIYCQFIPYKMHLKSRGKSKKFWCYRTNKDRRYYNDRHALVADAVGISKAGLLVNREGRVLRYDDGAAKKPEIIKVKYTTGSSRGREVYTEVAVSRFLWALGLPADRMFPAEVWCDGCTEDPFGDIRTSSDNYARRETNFFPDASIERKLGKIIEVKEDEGWSWDDVYEESRWDRHTRVEFEAYVLALNMVHFHNGVSKQNSVACESGYWDSETGICSRPVIYLDDPGSTFGGGRSRGKHGKYRENTVFPVFGACGLRADLAGFGSVSEAARQFLTDRLQRFTEPVVQAIFSVARFNEETTDASLEEWVGTLMKRIHEVTTTRCS